MNLEGIDHVALSVADIERSTNWYIDVLGFERRFDGMWNGVPVFIGLGKTAIALFPIRSGKLVRWSSGESSNLASCLSGRPNIVSASRKKN